MAVDLDSMAENAERIWEDSILPSLGEFIEIHALSPMFEPNWDEVGELQATIDLFCSWLDNQGIRRNELQGSSNRRSDPQCS